MEFALHVTFDLRNSHLNEVIALHNMESTVEREDESAVYRALWQACAGPFVTIPRSGDLVIYFPQGHLDQGVTCTESGEAANGEMMELNDIPWMILCCVVQVHLKAEVADDEVFAEITLFPLPIQDEMRVEYNNNNNGVTEVESAEEQRINIYSFSKKLNPSDISTHGGFSILKRHAERCLPPLDNSADSAMQMLVAKDLHGNQWQFRHVFRGNPKRHLLTTGWASFLVAKRLALGDAFVFIRDENGEVRVGVRRAKGHQIQSSKVRLSSSEITTLRNAILARTNFTVSYWPRRCEAEFIVGYERYMNSILNNNMVGTRFEMDFEGQRGDQRLNGIIVGIEEIDPIRWTQSKWRCLQVRWDDDDDDDNSSLPHRVSPWSITPIATS